jgi:tripartite-type tricarboxylate transporter receptor subunit TctC
MRSVDAPRCDTHHADVPRGRWDRDMLIARMIAILFALIAAPTSAQEWPAGPVRVIVPYAAGGPLDLPCRLLIDRLAAQTKGTFILEHRAGAGGAIGAQAVVASPPDGATFLFTSSSISAAPALYPKLGFDPLQALIPISLVTEFPISIAVGADSEIRDLADLLAKAKAQPGKYTYGTGGIGTGNHLGTELLKRSAGIDLLHVPFRGISLAVSALYSGDIDIVVTSAHETLGHVRDGRMRALGVGGRTRIPELPDVPAISELVSGYVMTNWYGLFAPRGVPAHILARLQSELPAVRSDPTLQQRAAAAGIAMLVTDADALRALMATEVPRWRQIVPELGLKVE